MSFSIQEERQFATLVKSANLFLEQGLFDKAIKTYIEALEMEPSPENRSSYNQLGTIHNNIGMAFANQGSYNKAIQIFKIALQFDPTKAEIHYNLGNAFYYAGEIDQAIKAFQKALEYNPNDSTIYSNLGIALIGKGRRDEAKQLFEKALELNPNDEIARQELSEFQKRESSQYQINELEQNMITDVINFLIDTNSFRQCKYVMIENRESDLLQFHDDILYNDKNKKLFPILDNALNVLDEVEAIAILRLYFKNHRDQLLTCRSCHQKFPFISCTENYTINLKITDQSLDNYKILIPEESVIKQLTSLKDQSFGENFSDILVQVLGIYNSCKYRLVIFRYANYTFIGNAIVSIPIGYLPSITAMLKQVEGGICSNCCRISLGKPVCYECYSCRIDEKQCILRSGPRDGVSTLEKIYGLRYGKMGTIYNNAYQYQQAIGIFQKAAIQGFPEAQYHLGIFHEYGKGVAINSQEAINWYKRAAEKGHSSAQDKLQKMTP